MEKLYVIKIGGNIVDDEIQLSSFLQAFSQLSGKKILVHGGGKVATNIGNTLGITSKYHEGRRITDEATIDLVTMVYGGLINKKIVAQLQSFGTQAIGITGADANLIPAVKRPVSPKNGIDFGFVGDVKSDQIHTRIWQMFLQENLVPVVAPLTHDTKGHMLNTNADTMAQEVAKALSGLYQTELIYSFEKAGVLLNVEDDQSLIPTLNKSYYAQLKNEEKIFAGMIPKLDNAFAALESGVYKVVIGKAEQLNSLISGSTGTSIVHE